MPTRPENPLAACRYCPARIRWVTTVDGRRLPLDPEPSEDGIVVPLHVGGRLLARVLREDERQGAEVAGPRFRPHWQTCPGADQARADARADARFDVRTSGGDDRPSRQPRWPACAVCHLPMIIVEAGQTTHPNCANT
jgi:hypothetical protein